MVQFRSRATRTSEELALPGPAVGFGGIRTSRGGTRSLLVIWLLQQAPIGSVEGCPDQRFPRRFASFSPTLPARRPARSIWRLVAGQMGLFAFDAGTKDATNW